MKRRDLKRLQADPDTILTRIEQLFYGDSVAWCEAWGYSGA